jgi:GH18 family chitinase
VIPTTKIFPTSSTTLITIQETATTDIPLTTSEVNIEPEIAENISAIETETAVEIAKPADFKVVGYITHWHLNKLSSIKIEGLTHLIWQGLEVNSSTDPTLRVANNAGWWQISDVVEAGHANGVKVLASLIGPWKESVLTTIWNSSEKRGSLIENLVSLVKSYDLDGIDLDNENKSCTAEIYSTFIRELYDALSPMGKIITLAGNPYHTSINTDVFSCIDLVNVMTYDMGAPAHSTLEDSTSAINKWADGGMPKNKILIGIPLYGRDANDTFYEYWWIVDKYNPGLEQNEIPEPKATGGIIWWNGPGLAREKVLYAKHNDYGGVMMYEIGTDTQGDASIIQAVYEAIQDSGLSHPIIVSTCRLFFP